MLNDVFFIPRKRCQLSAMLSTQEDSGSGIIMVFNRTTDLNKESR